MSIEYVGNLHNHTVYSDGTGEHAQVARAAIDAGLDFVVVTDHNVWVEGMDGYRYHGDKRVLLLTGEEVHDPSRDPQKNHLLVFETQRELAPYAKHPERLLKEVARSGGLAFIAHPIDPAAEKFNEPDISWVDWDIEGFHGLELWNFMSEFKSKLASIAHGLYYAYLPQRIPDGPFPQVLERWDALLSAGKEVAVIGNADGHALHASLGPLKKTLFPYELLFRSINTHVLLDQPLSGEVALDRNSLFQAVKRGSCFVANDYYASARGFRFTAQSDRGPGQMGSRVRSRFGITLQLKSPLRTNIELIHNGKVINRWMDVEAAVHTVSEPGAYRVECRQPHDQNRGWIYSNPIYVDLH